MSLLTNKPIIIEYIAIDLFIHDIQTSTSVWILMLSVGSILNAKIHKVRIGAFASPDLSPEQLLPQMIQIVSVNLTSFMFNIIKIVNHLPNFCIWMNWCFYIFQLKCSGHHVSTSMSALWEFVNKDVQTYGALTDVIADQGIG